MSKTEDKQLKLADDYAAALDQIGNRVEANTTAALRRSLLALFKSLRKYYGQYVDPNLPATPSGDGVIRRPGAYSIADGSAKFKALIDIAQGYLPEEQLRAMERMLQRAFTEAVTLGGELGQELARNANPQDKAQAPFVGPSKAAIEAAAATTSAYIRGEVESFRDNLVRIVTDGIGQGLGAKKLEGQIRVALEGAKDPQGLNNKMGFKQRAALIARSELANAYVGAQKAAAARNGFNYGRWIATKDERTCPVCASRHGRIYRLEEMVGTLHPRCRCSISPVSAEAVEEQNPEQRKQLLREDYWGNARDTMIKEFAGGKGKVVDGKLIPIEFDKASKILEEAIKKPSPSERRQYPDMKVAPQPVA